MQIMKKRIKTTLVIAIIGLPALIYGGIFFLLLFVVALGIATWEFVNLMRGAGFQPAMSVAIIGVESLLLVRVYYPEHESVVLVLFVFIAMTLHAIAFERGRNESAGDFAITVTAITYLGWVGAYLVKLRALPDGLWWFSLVLPIVWFTDSGAYFFGSSLGKHKLSPHLSPKKTWEGYIGGVFVGVLAGIFFAWLWRENLPLTLLNGAIFGLVLSSLTTLGDLGASMIKRQSGIKDSSHILPGHGGIFDRIDTWIWAAPLGYYLIHYFFI
ncbi:MAG TPA: phosphatidate cytidylyltransferase [Anaerolineales bacterium]|nr:phosphatidate cytidylyltransferase [Anaerolineales bacterium]